MLKTAYCHCEDIWGPGFSVTGQNAKVKRYPNLAMLSCPDPVDTVLYLFTLMFSHFVETLKTTNFSY